MGHLVYNKLIHGYLTYEFKTTQACAQACEVFLPKYGPFCDILCDSEVTLKFAPESKLFCWKDESKGK